MNPRAEEKAKDGTVCVGIGCIVSIKFQNNSTRVFEITDSIQRVAPEKGVISHESPLGKALIGREAGERVSYIVSDRTLPVEILSISKSL